MTKQNNRSKAISFVQKSDSLLIFRGCCPIIHSAKGFVGNECPGGYTIYEERHSSGILSGHCHLHHLWDKLHRRFDQEEHLGRYLFALPFLLHGKDQLEFEDWPYRPLQPQGFFRHQEERSKTRRKQVNRNRTEYKTISPHGEIFCLKRSSDLSFRIHQKQGVFLDGRCPRLDDIGIEDTLSGKDGHVLCQRVFAMEDDRRIVG